MVLQTSTQNEKSKQVIWKFSYDWLGRFQLLSFRFLSGLNEYGADIDLVLDEGIWIYNLLIIGYYKLGHGLVVVHLIYE